MKKLSGVCGLILISFFILGNINVSAQSTGTSGKIKSKITHEEKTIKGVKSNYIDSEEKYDLNGNVTEEIQYKDGKVDKHFLYEYDAGGNKIKETEIDASGKPKKISEYTYVNGLRTEKNTYDANRKLISKKKYTYTY